MPHTLAWNMGTMARQVEDEELRGERMHGGCICLSRTGGDFPVFSCVLRGVWGEDRVL